jgi:hypothetical protein
MTGVDNDKLETAIREAFGEIEKVYGDATFRQALDELWTLQPGEERQVFVRDQLLDRSARNARGLELPESVEIQRTYFDDDRPTLFALVAHLLPGLIWEKVTITVDDVDASASD